MLALAALLFSLVLPPDSLDAAGHACPGAQVLMQSDIEAAGAVRLAGLLRLLDAPRRHTTHGFLWPTLFGEGAPSGPGETALVLDGEPLAPDLLGLGDLERLPADVPDLARLTFCPGPQLVDGRLWDGGALFLETRSEPGLRGGVFIGNEVGDPGPFRYVNGNVNIDKFGPDYAGAAVWRDRQTAAVSADARFKIRRFYATDPEVYARTVAAAGEFPRLRFLSGEVRGRFGLFGGRHAASAMASGGNLLPLIPTLGQEVAARPIWAQGALSGHLPLRTGIALAYRVRGAHEQAESRNPAFPAMLDWSARAGHALLEVRATRGVTRTVWGGSVQHVGVSAPGGVGGFTLGRLHAQVQRGGWGLVGSGVFSPSGQGGTSAGWLTRTFGATRLTSSLDVARTLPEERAGLAFWHSRGAGAFTLSSVDRSVASVRSRDAVRLRLDASRPVGALHLHGTAGMRAARGVGVEQARFAALDSLRLPTTGTATFRAGASGIDGHVGAAAEGRRGIARARLFVDARGALTGTAAYREAWRTVPAVRGGGRLSLHPDPSFSAFTSLEVLSGTRWAAYADDREHLPPVVLLDAALWKTLWRGRLRTTLLFRNLLSAPERYEPRGVALDLRLYARAVLHLP